ncbi:conserved hypothetical protein [Ricinus communis]|uniref:Serine-threonine protein kinase, plant-type n=1 Tax=Ricinus communis TaxID=3988 RepID=B9RBK0_RICCO|nr:conserved hypothetical protein [Ricinus communis]
MNNFGGNQIPAFIGALKNLTYLNLSSASFGGMIPPTLGNLSSLQIVDLNNQYKEPTESDLSWITNISSLKYLNLGVELHLNQYGLFKLHATLPSINFTSLLVLDLFDNDFSSTIPHWLFNMSSLEDLNLKINNLLGEFTDGFANLNLL